MALVITCTGLFAQEAASRQSAGAAIRGTVHDSAGKPVDHALVHLDRAGKPGWTMTTSADGTFLFKSIGPGRYQLSVEKVGRHSPVVSVTTALSGEVRVDLVLGAASGSAADSEVMAFADKPNFTVAGITDWTAVGGHGSDASLRTSEALARETASLKPEEASGTGSAVGASETEARLRAALAASPESFAANHEMGEFCFRKGDYREAIAPLATAYRIEPTNRGNEYDLARAYKETGNFSQARQLIQNLLTHEDTADLHRVSGEIDEAQGDSVAAEHEYEQAVKLDPSEQNYFAWGSELLLHRAVWPAAEVFQKGSETHPKSARMLAALGAALFAGAKYDEAALRLCEASDLNPADPAPYVFLGKIDMAAPVPLDCVEPKLQRFVQQQPDNAGADYYYAMAIWKRLQGVEDPHKMQQVETLLTKATVNDPKYGEAYLQLGNFYGDKRDSDKAIRFYVKAIEANPQLSEAHYKLGMVYERAGESAKAKQEFEIHDEVEKAQAAVVERQRQEVKQFLVVLQSGPAVH